MWFTFPVIILSGLQICAAVLRPFLCFCQCLLRMYVCILQGVCTTRLVKETHAEYKDWFCVLFAWVGWLSNSCRVKQYWVWFKACRLIHVFCIGACRHAPMGKTRVCKNIGVKAVFTLNNILFSLVQHISFHWKAKSLMVKKKKVRSDKRKRTRKKLILRSKVGLE